MRSTSEAAAFSPRRFLLSSWALPTKSSEGVFACAVRHAPRLCALALLAAALQCSGAFGQGFGGTKKTITLQRKLPAVVHLPGTAIDIQPADRNQAGDVAQALSDMLLVTLQKNDTRLHADKNSPDVVIAYSIITYQAPSPTAYTRQEPQLQNKRMVQVPVQYYKVTGELTIAYRAMDAHKKTLDAGPITTKYSQDFQASSYSAVDQIGGESVGPFTSKINPFSLGKKKPEENPAPPTPVQVRQKLLDGVVSQLAARLVNTQETVEVLLARGKFDDANKLAEKAQWTRFLEALETMRPLPNPADDAYRLYNIGVANEALAYQAEDKTAVQKFLQEAAIEYGKAIDAKLSERYFADPQTRIETAVAHYKKLSEGANTTEDTATRASSIASGAATGVPPAGDGNSAAAGSKTARGTPNSVLPMTNADIIKMAKAGVDEESIIAAIQDAANVNFVLSPDDLIALANAGVKGKIVGAMRVRSKQPKRRATSSTPH